MFDNLQITTMTLLNHIGVLILLILVGLLVEMFDRNSKLKSLEVLFFPTAAMTIIWIVFEAFYWTFKIFF